MEKLNSRKLWAFAASTVLLLLDALLGLGLPVETKTALVGLAASYFIGQGIADHGK